MIKRDIELLTRIARVNRDVGELIVPMMADRQTVELPAAKLRELGQAYAALSADILARASEIEGKVVDHVIIDARP